MTRTKRLVRAIIYVGLIIFGPFVLLYNIYKKRKSKVKYSTIVNGFANYVFPNERMEQVAIKRASICAQCPFAKENKIAKKMVKDSRLKHISGLYCEICGCNLSAKVRANDYCPKGKW